MAVALADFCRRAQGAVDPRTVRDALSLLDASRDAEVVELTQAEPQARPLGPFAVIDVLERTLSAEAAAERQRSGAYDAVELTEVVEPAAPAAVPPRSELSPAPAEGEPEETEPGRRRRRSAKAEVAARIAPRHRKASDPPAAPAPASHKPTRWAPFHKKDLPLPRGRYTRVDLTKAKVHKLLDPHMREELEQLITQHGHRVAVRRALDPIYLGKKGEALTVADIEEALRHHELRSVIEEREKALLLSAVSEARGDLGRAALTLGMRGDELEHVMLNCGAQADVAKIREHHAREALAHGNLRHKLELLDRQKYLADLGVEKRFRDALALELTEVMDLALAKATDLDGLLNEVAKQQALPYEKLKVAVDRAGLSAAYRHRLQSPTLAST
ncbi:MAG: hypothetical protein IPJ65_32895 [Archangiaceae bacterium]|nr:hypothetical protein [Archangiaceae bacterium]